MRCIAVGATLLSGTAILLAGGCRDRSVEGKRMTVPLNQKTGRTNHLAGEKSPYLLQHAAQPGGLVSVGRRGLRQGARREQADLPQHRLLDLPLVPRHGARVVRERGRSPRFLNEHFVSIKVDREERPDVDQHLHDVRAGDDRPGRLADERLPDAGPEAVLRRHVFPADQLASDSPASWTC